LDDLDSGDRITKEFEDVGYADMTTAIKIIYLNHAAAWRVEKRDTYCVDPESRMCARAAKYRE
jgi:hypothetical protein